MSLLFLEMANNEGMEPRLSKVEQLRPISFTQRLQEGARTCRLSILMVVGDAPAQVPTSPFTWRLSDMRGRHEYSFASELKVFALAVSTVDTRTGAFPCIHGG